jgi:hypothetical protein
LCFVTYLDQQFSFDDASLLKYAKKVKKLESANADEFLFLKDLLESVCLLVKDGDIITFSHRSFQEYFASTYLINTDAIDLKNLIEIMIRRSDDNVVDLAFETRKELIELKYVIPSLSELLDIVSTIDINHKCSEYIDYICSKLQIGKFSHERICLGFSTEHKKYGMLFSKLFKWYRHYFTEHLFLSEEDVNIISNARPELGLTEQMQQGGFVEFEVSTADNAWIIKSDLPALLNLDIQALRKLLEDLKTSHANKKKLLSDLILDMKGAQEASDPKG